MAHRSRPFIIVVSYVADVRIVVNANISISYIDSINNVGVANDNFVNIERVQMAVITFANPKGGVGKTTTALITAMELDRAGANVAFYDLDPNENVVSWRNRRDQEGRATSITVRPRPAEIEKVLDDVESLDDQFDYVVVDLEGTRDKIVTYALSTSDVVLIPTNGSTMEVIQGADTVRLIKSTSKMTKRNIPFAFVFTRMNAAFQSLDEKSVLSELAANELPFLQTRVVTRSPYSQIFREGKTLSEIRDSAIERTKDDVASKQKQALGQVDKAIMNVSDLVKEVLEFMDQEAS